MIRNFADFPAQASMENSADPAKVSRFINRYFVKSPTSAAEAQSNIADLFPAECQENVARAKTAYLVFDGLSQAVPTLYNKQTQIGEVLQWAQERDPNALFFSMNWVCPILAAHGLTQCVDFRDRLAMDASHPALKNLSRALKVIAGKDEFTAAKLSADLKGPGDINQWPGPEDSFNTAAGGYIYEAGHLIDQLLAAGFTDIRMIGYSMGSQAVAEILRANYMPSDSAEKGFEWSSPGVCPGGKRACTVAELPQLKWALVMGLPGWSDALRYEYNGFDASGHARKRSKGEIEQYHNGGLFKLGGEYGGKLNVLNRRDDPTAIADDFIERLFNDFFLDDYNHTSHTYARPWFLNARMKRLINRYVDAKSAPALPEIGILTDDPATVDFNDCSGSAVCQPSANYVALGDSEKPSILMRSANEVKAVEGAHPADGSANLAADLSEGAKPVIVRTMDQEDLRGSVEFFFKPNFNPAKDAALHGLYSYGSCGGSKEDLMPEAYFEGGNVVFSLRYLGKPYTVRVSAKHLKQDQWTHFAFSWELPTRPLSVDLFNMSDEVAKQLQGDIKDHGLDAIRKQAGWHVIEAFKALITLKNQVAPAYKAAETGLPVVAALINPPVSSFRRQIGNGTMRVWINGVERGHATISDQGEGRDCLTSDLAANDKSYEVAGPGSTKMLPYMPYENYTRDAFSNKMQLDPNIADSLGLKGLPTDANGRVTIGALCKGYRIRNEEVHFGCAKSGVEAASADGAMDDVMVTLGTGRTEFDNVEKRTGRPLDWITKAPEASRE